MLTWTKDGRKICAMTMNASVDRCRGVVQCALEGCQMHMALVEPGTIRASGNTEDMSTTEQIAWFLHHHDCHGIAKGSP